MLQRELSGLFQRDLSRLSQELRAFRDTDALWCLAPGVSNAAGTLALHLEGNLREYIGRLLGGIAYTRERPREFSARGVEREELLRRVDALVEAIPKVLAALPAETLEAAYPEPFNGAMLSTEHVLLHLLGHFNYHLGQIDYLRRFTSGDGAIELAGL